MTAAEQFRQDYEIHLSTWGPHCGAPLAVYRGHLNALLSSHMAAVEARLLGLETAEVDSLAMREYLQKRVRSEVTR